jgi:hypothetical protein
MRVLIACEYSGIVRDAFTEAGHDATSCDILPTEIPGKHIQGDVLEVIHNNWDMIIAFPPCTDLSNAQAGPVMRKKIEQGKPQKALEFIKKIYDAAPMVCIENPLSQYLNNNWLPYDQIIQPYYFGHNYEKRTCLWLKNLPFLMSTIYNYPKYLLVNEGSKRQKRLGMANTAKDRSKFHPFVAQAMANQWGTLEPLTRLS